ncbi:MAG: glycosyltransferase [Sedimentisphaerales bacterium]|nr:glycosyltransferase [Sedimentisphaerales bacterium]
MSTIKETFSDSAGSFEVIKPEAFITSPEISVVMSVYNGERYLHGAVDSILNQSFKDFEFIIINDGSNDGSFEVILEYQARDRRIVLVNQNNIGLTSSLNRGIRLSRCEHIARQDADDVSLASRLEKQLGFLKGNPKVAVVGCFGEIFNNEGTVSPIGNLKLSSRGVKKYLLRQNPMMHGSVMMRKSCLEKAGFYRGFFRHAQDYDLWLRLSESFDLAVLPEPLYRYRVSADAISVSKFLIQKQYADIARRLHKERLASGKDSYDALIQSYPDGLPVTDNEAAKCEYHLFLAKGFIFGNNFGQARQHLRLAWKQGCRRSEVFVLFLKTLLGVRVLSILRRLKNSGF